MSKPPQTAVSPQVELEGFTRIHLRAGETRHVQFTLSPRQLSEVDEKGNRAVTPGDYQIYIAGGQPEAETPAATFTFRGQQRCRSDCRRRRVADCDPAASVRQSLNLRGDKVVNKHQAGR